MCALMPRTLTRAHMACKLLIFWYVSVCLRRGSSAEREFRRVVRRGSRDTPFAPPRLGHRWASRMAVEAGGVNKPYTVSSRTAMPAMGPPRLDILLRGA